MNQGVRLAGLGPGVLQDPVGNVIAARGVYVLKRDAASTTVPNQVQVYSDEALTTTVSQPILSDANGVLPGYVAPGQSVDLYDSVTTGRMQAEVLLASSVVGDSSSSGGTSDSVVYTSKYINSGLFASATAAVQQAYNDLPGTGGTLVLPPTDGLVLDNVAFTSKPLVLQGVAGRTRLLPGASGRIWTANYTGDLGNFSVQGIAIGELRADTSPNRSYTTPLIEFQNFTGYLDLTGLYAFINGTGTICRLSSTGNLVIRGGQINSGAYGIPFLFDTSATPATNLDTIRFDSAPQIWGNYGPIFRTGLLGSTAKYIQVEFGSLKTVGFLDQAIIDDLLSYTVGFGEVSAGATTIQVANAGWAVGDSVYIEGDFATDSGGRTGGTAEVNRVTGVSGTGPYVLTLSQPLTFAHGTNAGAFHVQVLRGGVGLSLANSMSIVSGSMHNEVLAWGIIDYGTSGSQWDRCSRGTNRFLRLAGNTTDVAIGLHYNNGRGGEGHVLDLPSWNTSAFDRFDLMGPWVHSNPDVLDSGANVTLDNLASGTILATKTFTVRETISGNRRTSHHTPTGQGAGVPMRYQSGTSADNIDMGSGGTVFPRIVIGTITTLTYGATVTPNASGGGPWQKVTVTDANAITMAAPSNPPTSAQSRELIIEVLNSSGGAMGVITWNAAFVFNGFVWTNPASTKRRWARFQWNGTNWICTGIAGADY